MSKPNIDRQDMIAGPDEEDGRGGTAQAGADYECAGADTESHCRDADERAEHDNAAPGSAELDSAARHAKQKVHDGAVCDTTYGSAVRHNGGSRPDDLPKIEAPGLTALAAHDASPAAEHAAAGEDSPATGAVFEADPMPSTSRPAWSAAARPSVAEPIDDSGANPGRAGSDGRAARAGGVLVEVMPPQRAEWPRSPEPPLAPPPAPSFGLRRLLAITALAAIIGGLAGSLTSAGFTAMVGSPSAGPSYDQVFADSLARIDHEVAVLKGTIDTSTKAQTQQVAKIADRLDRAEKAQNDTGTRLAKAGDVLDRVERRLGASGEATGGLGEARSASGSSPAPGPSAGHVPAAVPSAAAAGSPALVAAAAASPPPEAKIVDGWVLRDVYRGTAMIQSRGGGIVAVQPGESLPGFGRIEAIKRLDGRWVVVTARGLILQR